MAEPLPPGDRGSTAASAPVFDTRNRTRKYRHDSCGMRHVQAPPYPVWRCRRGAKGALLGGDCVFRRPNLLNQPAQDRKQPAGGLRRRSWCRGRLADGLLHPFLGLALEIPEIGIFVAHGSAGPPDSGPAQRIVRSQSARLNPGARSRVTLVGQALVASVWPATNTAGTTVCTTGRRHPPTDLVIGRLWRRTTLVADAACACPHQAAWERAAHLRTKTVKQDQPSHENHEAA
jgi:hypothetical protein